MPRTLWQQSTQNCKHATLLKLFQYLFTTYFTTIYRPCLSISASTSYQNISFQSHKLKSQTPILKILGICDELGKFGYAKTLLKIASFKFQANPRPRVATADMVQTTPHRASHQEGTRCNDPGTIRTTRTLAGSRK